MTIEEAAHALHEFICPHGPSFRPSWFVAVGIGANRIIVYSAGEKDARRALADHIACGVGGYPVEVREMGHISPLGGT